MSKATKRKHVLKEIFDDDFSLPKANQQIVRILNSRGNNLHEVETVDQSRFLVSMPTKFRKNFWVKRGNYVLIEPIEEGDKVKGEMVRILTSEHIKYYKKDNVWPSEFDNDKNKRKQSLNDDDEEEELFVNTNRLQISSEEEESSSDEESGD